MLRETRNLSSDRQVRSLGAVAKLAGSRRPWRGFAREPLLGLWERGSYVVAARASTNAP
jgi:hypothetical protein